MDTSLVRIGDSYLRWLAVWLRRRQFTSRASNAYGNTVVITWHHHCWKFHNPDLDDSKRDVDFHQPGHWFSCSFGIHEGDSIRDNAIYIDRNGCWRDSHICDLSDCTAGCSNRKPVRISGHNNSRKLRHPDLGHYKCQDSFHQSRNWRGCRLRLDYSEPHNYDAIHSDSNWAWRQYYRLGNCDRASISSNGQAHRESHNNYGWKFIHSNMGNRKCHDGFH